MASIKALSGSHELDFELLRAILRVTRSARLRTIIRDLLGGPPRRS